MIALALVRFVLRTPWSTLVTLLGITLGVASIVSVHMVSATVAKRLDQLTQPQLAGFTHVLHRPNLDLSDYVALRQRWRRGEFVSVETLSVLIDEYTVIDGQTVQVIGIDLLHPFRQAAVGAAPVETLDWQGVWVSDDKLAQGRTINGRLKGDGQLLLADIGVVQDLLAWPAARLSYIGVALNDPLASVKANAERWLPGVSAGIPEAEDVLSVLREEGWQVRSVSAQQPATRFAKSVLFNISALGTLALLVAWFLIYQVAVTWLRRLQQVFERLFALGVERWQLAAYFVGLLAVLGLLSAGLGVAVGYLFAQQLYAAAVPAATEPMLLDGWVLMKAGVSALLVCVLGGGLAFQRLFAPRSLPLPLSLAGLAILIAVAAGGVLWEQSGLMGVFMSIAVLSVLTGLAVAPLLRVCRTQAQRLPGSLLARLSGRELFWYPADLSVALAGLTLAVATAIGVGIMVDSFRLDFSRMLDRRLTYDVVVDGQPDELAALARAMAADDSGLLRVQRYRSGSLRIAGVPCELIVTSMDRFESARYGHDKALLAHQVLIGEQLSRRLNVGAGDLLTIGTERFEIAGAFQGFGDVQPRVVVDALSPLAQRTTQLDGLSMQIPEPQAWLQRMRQQHPNVQFTLQTTIRQRALETFDDTFAITSVLISIAIVVAATGVYIAATAMRLNRQAGTRLLQTLGVSLRELLLADLWRGLTFGVAAVVFALPLGLLLGWILCAVVNPRAFGWVVDMQLTWVALAPPVLWGLLAAVIAGVVRVGQAEESNYGVR